MSVKLTAQQRRFWGGYIRDAFDGLGLRDWWFDLERELLDEEPVNQDGQLSGATCDVIEGRRRARISLSQRFLTMSPDDQRQMIAHEAVHCHFDDAWKMVMNDLEDILGRPTDAMFTRSFRRAMEHGIDAVAQEARRLLPLPRPPK